MLEFLVSATLLGLAGGFGPGPLLALVIAETLQHGRSAGFKVAIAPLVTDAPIIFVSLLVLSRLSHTHWPIGLLSIAGGLVVFKMGYESMRPAGADPGPTPPTPHPLRRGAVVNALNPHPYIFWFSVGGTTTVRAAEAGLPVAVVFVAALYASLVGSKLLVALAVERSRAFLSGRVYTVTLRALGVALCLFAILLIRDGLRLIASG